MTYAAQSARYVENDVLSRSPEWLVPLMYEHLLGSLRRAAVQAEIGDLEGRSDSLAKATSIVGELLCTLDREKGGEIAEGLASLYAYFAIEILNIGRSKDAGTLPRLIELVAELHEAWVEAAEQISPRTARPALAISAA